MGRAGYGASLCLLQSEDLVHVVELVIERRGGREVLLGSVLLGSREAGVDLALLLGLGLGFSLFSVSITLGSCRVRVRVRARDGVRGRVSPLRQAYGRRGRGVISSGRG